MKKIVVDLGKCTGCRTCQIICAMSHEGVLNYELARISVTKDDKLGVSAVVPCSQCKKAPCVDVCPTGANAWVPATGANVIDPEKCIGCELCLTACPFGSISMIARNGQETAVKCDLCNGDPQCVKFCEPQAIRYEEPRELAKLKADVFSGKFLEIIREIKGMAEDT